MRALFQHKFAGQRPMIHSSKPGNFPSVMSWVDLLVNIKAFERVVRPVMRDHAQGLTGLPWPLADGVEDRGIRTIVNDGVGGDSHRTTAPRDNRAATPR